MMINTLCINVNKYFLKDIVLKIELKNNFIIKLISKYKKMWYT